ncbi:hypothetical protein OAG38_04695 [Akkermansiaceae bacterium]|nr:hypothetical protein [Akkermansiaceae bacterium]MDB4763022.1 hypothetical protein [Akkermansiaceae bacterium]
MKFAIFEISLQPLLPIFKRIKKSSRERSGRTFYTPDTIEIYEFVTMNGASGFNIYRL